MTKTDYIAAVRQVRELLRSDIRKEQPYQMTRTDEMRLRDAYHARYRLSILIKKLEG